MQSKRLLFAIARVVAESKPPLSRIIAFLVFFVINTPLAIIADLHYISEP
jgi:hypothetical protein